MSHHLDPALSQEIRATVGDLPPYAGDPHGLAIDYTGAPVAYAVNVTLLHGGFEWHPAGLHLPTSETSALLVRRASGDGKVGSWSGISGYVDTLHDPKGLLTDKAFDPVAYTARAEPHEECGIAWEEMRAIDMYLGATVIGAGINLALGRRFAEPRFGQPGTINLLPLVGVCYSEPRIAVNRQELSEAKWVSLGAVAQLRDLSPGYLENTLPNALGAFGLRAEAISGILKS